MDRLARLVLAVVPTVALAHAAPASALRAESSATFAAQRPPYVERYDWPATWRELDRLRDIPLDDERFRARWKELDELAAGRERDSRTLRDRPARFRARLLRAELADLARNPPQIVPDPNAPIEFNPGEAWMAARHLVSGPLRVRAYREAIAEVTGELREARRDRAIDAVDEDLRYGRLTNAEALARFLYDSSPTAGSTLALSRVLRAASRDAEALPLLESALEQRGVESRDRARLALERARLERNLGHQSAVARWRGVALTEDSPHAALEAAETALRDGDLSAASALYRALLEGERRGAAWRGWGLAQLSAPTASAPGTRNLGNLLTPGN